MLSLGYQLYQLSERDDLTIQLEPLFRRLPFSLGVGVASVQIPLNLPPDRALYIAALTWQFNGEAGTTWTGAALLIQGFNFSAFGNVGGLGFAGAASGAGGAGSLTDHPRLILPAGAGSVIGLASRIGTTGAASGELDIAGYLIPPGTMTRGFS